MKIKFMGKDFDLAEGEEAVVGHFSGVLWVAGDDEDKVTFNIEYRHGVVLEFSGPPRVKPQTAVDAALKELLKLAQKLS